MNPHAVTQAILTRRSCCQLTDPAPAREELLDLIQTAATAPDHGRIRPWRLIIVEGDARSLLGDALSDAAPSPEHGRRAKHKPMRAPLLLSIVFKPEPEHPVVAEWEQLAAVAAMVQTLLLLLHSAGWGAIWRTGSVVDAAQVRNSLGLTDDERLLGWLYIGTQADGATRTREPVDVSSRVSWLGQTQTPDSNQLVPADLLT